MVQVCGSMGLPQVDFQTSLTRVARLWLNRAPSQYMVAIQWHCRNNAATFDYWSVIMMFVVFYFFHISLGIERNW